MIRKHRRRSRVLDEAALQKQQEEEQHLASKRRVQRRRKLVPRLEDASFGCVEGSKPPLARGLRPSLDSIASGEIAGELEESKPRPRMKARGVRRSALAVQSMTALESRAFEEELMEERTAIGKRGARTLHVESILGRRAAAARRARLTRPQVTPATLQAGAELSERQRDRVFGAGEVRATHARVGRLTTACFV